jgi:hypothetical protein
VSQRPDLNEQREFLLRAYFGAEGDQTDRFISRAYRDMNRTLRGIRRREDATALLQRARAGLRESLGALESHTAPTDPDKRAGAFDGWHHSACERLIDRFRPFRCSYGQAQKWLNMTIKYCWFFMDASKLDAWYAVAHVPVDDIILRAVEMEAGVARPWSTWSGWNDPKGYQDYQTAIRNYWVDRHQWR